MRIFADRLKYVRNHRGMSQRELARRCNFSLNQISRYENDLIDPIIPQLYEISKQLNVSADYLLGLISDSHGIPEPGEPSKSRDELIRVFDDEGWPGVIRLGAERIAK